MAYPSIAEAKDVKFLRIEPNADGTELLVEGLVFHSALAVKSLETVDGPEARQMLIHLTPARRGLSGSFSFGLTIPNQATRVLFGREAVQIWPPVPRAGS